MKLQIFTSTTKDGIMSDKREYFKNFTKKERKLIYESTLERFFSKININYKNVIFLNDDSKKITSCVVTENKKSPKDAILILKSNTKDLVVAAKTCDDPIIIGSVNLENGSSVSAMAKLSLSNLETNIIHELIESLIKETNAAPFEITFYISACPSKENYILPKETNIINDKDFSKTITKKKNKYYFDIRYAIFNQLISEIVDPNYIYFSELDPVADKNYFSDLGNKPGKNLVCMVYKDEESI